MYDFFQSPDDKLAVDPTNLGPAVAAVLTRTLARQLAGQYKEPWTDKQESVG